MDVPHPQPALAGFLRTLPLASSSGRGGVVLQVSRGGEDGARGREGSTRRWEEDWN